MAVISYCALPPECPHPFVLRVLYLSRKGAELRIIGRRVATLARVYYDGLYDVRLAIVKLQATTCQQPNSSLGLRSPPYFVATCWICWPGYCNPGRQCAEAEIPGIPLDRLADCQHFCYLQPTPATNTTSLTHDWSTSAREPSISPAAS